MKTFAQALSDGDILVFDGAMGTMLEEKGLDPGPWCNVEAWDEVVGIHKAYLEAGADVLISNTFAANRIALERYGRGARMAEYNLAGVELCRQVADGRAYVAGDIGPTGQMLEPYGDYSQEQFYEVFAEQAAMLKSAGADLIIIETMSDLREAVTALEACIDSTMLPVVVSISFDRAGSGYRTVMGDDIESCVCELDAAGANVVGANCGSVTPEQMAELLAEMRRFTNKPIIAEPNAGLPELVGGKAVFSLPPEDFARGVLKCIEAGARLVGGCCGTTPAHIESLVDLVRGARKS
jgi:5-methyltetrahydrofolate--homocysteine methyltransferase